MRARSEKFFPAGKPDASLRLIDVRSWEDSDNILVRYEVLHKSV